MNSEHWKGVPTWEHALKAMAPLALEMPLGKSVILKAAFWNCTRPFTCGELRSPRTDALAVTTPEAVKSRLIS